MNEAFLWFLIASGWIAAALIYWELRVTREIIYLEAHDAFIEGYKTCAMDTSDEAAEAEWIDYIGEGNLHVR